MGLCIFIAHSWHVEVACLLSKLNVEQHVEEELKIDEMDLVGGGEKS